MSDKTPTTKNKYIERAKETGKIQLLSLATPNGIKISAALEELALPYEPYTIDIAKNEQFAPEFLEVSPNNRIPAIVDPDVPVVIQFKGGVQNKKVQLEGAFTSWNLVDLYRTENGWEKTFYLRQGTYLYRLVVDGITTTDPDKPVQVHDGDTLNVVSVTEEPLTIFESGAILVHLAEKTGKLIPTNWRQRKDTFQWLFWQVGGVGPMLGQYGHFSNYAPEKVPYAIERYEKESKRLFGVLEKQLCKYNFMAANEYTIADIATWPWVRNIEVGYKNTEILKEFPRVQDWVRRCLERPASQKALTVTTRD